MFRRAPEWTPTTVDGLSPGALAFLRRVVMSYTQWFPETDLAGKVEQLWVYTRDPRIVKGQLIDGRLFWAVRDTEFSGYAISGSQMTCFPVKVSHTHRTDPHMTEQKAVVVLRTVLPCVTHPT